MEASGGIDTYMLAIDRRQVDFVPQEEKQAA
jgi:hypothetical protein